MDLNEQILGDKKNPIRLIRYKKTMIFNILIRYISFLFSPSEELRRSYKGIEWFRLRKNHEVTDYLRI